MDNALSYLPGHFFVSFQRPELQHCINYLWTSTVVTKYRNSLSEVFLGKDVLKIWVFSCKFYKRKPVPKCDFNQVAKQLYATLLISHFGMGFLLYICCIFSEYLFLRTPLKGCFCKCIRKP